MKCPECISIFLEMGSMVKKFWGASKKNTTNILSIGTVRSVQLCRATCILSEHVQFVNLKTEKGRNSYSICSLKDNFAVF